MDSKLSAGFPKVTLATGAPVKPGEHHAWKWGTSTHIAAALVILLLALYGLTFSGHFSTDDEHILASRSLSLAFEGNSNDDRVTGNDRIAAYQALPAAQASPSLEIEPVQSIVGAGLARLALLEGSGRVQTLFLLNIFATALAAACVFASVRKLGYPDRTALVTALLFGLGTQAWPYTRTYFRDPLAMLFLAFAWLCALQLNQAGSRRGRILAGAGIILGLLLGILTKNTVTVAIPAVLILLIPFWKSLGSRGKLPHKPGRFQPWVVLLVGIALVGIVVFLLTASGPLARFSLNYYFQLLVFFFTSPHPNFLEAFFGPLVSPGKSLFLYSPVLLLSLAALVKKRIETFAAWGYVILLIVAQALFYDALWWGNVNWGLRFLAPAMPLLAIAAASLVDRILHLPKGWVWIGILGVLSGLVQVIGISAPLGEYYQAMMSLTPQVTGTLQVWTPGYSALIWTAGRILSGGKWDLTVLQVGMPGLLIAAGLTVLACLAWLQIHSRPAWITPLLLGCMVVAILLLPKADAADAAYYPARNDFQAVQADLQSLASRGDGLVINSYGSPAWTYWMNWGPANPAWVSLPFGLYDSSGLPASVEAILAAASQAHKRTWLLLPCDSPSSAALLAQKNQLPSLELVSEQVYPDGTCQTSLLLFQSK
ncbi:MAG: phospholipid carrier-dependent glycosyltransferase [Anaerolineales bacterium]